MAAPPALQAVRARVDVADRPALDGITFATTGDRILVLGAARALFEAVGGIRPVAHGDLRVQGTEPREAARTAIAAAAPLDPRLPPRWSVRTYVFWSARLAGTGSGGRARARDAAAGAMARLKIDHAAEVELGRADLLVRRATVVAAALATGASLLLFEDPTANLADDVARGLARSIVQATAGKRTIVFAGRLPLASALATDADEAVVIEGSDVVAQGAPAELASRERTVALRVHGDCDDFARVAREKGAKVVGTGPLLEVDLGPTLRVTDLLAVARDTDAVVVEVRPLARAFA